MNFSDCRVGGRCCRWGRMRPVLEESRWGVSWYFGRMFCFGRLTFDILFLLTCSSSSLELSLLTLLCHCIMKLSCLVVGHWLARYQWRIAYCRRSIHSGCCGCLYRWTCWFYSRGSESAPIRCHVPLPALQKILQASWKQVLCWGRPLTFAYSNIHCCFHMDSSRADYAGWSELSPPAVAQHLVVSESLGHQSHLLQALGLEHDGLVRLLVTCGHGLRENEFRWILLCYHWEPYQIDGSQTLRHLSLVSVDLTFSRYSGNLPLIQR